MGGQSKFVLLMQRFREGSQEAAQELFEEYGEHILRFVRRRLSSKLRSKFDSADFVQAVWASFFTVRLNRLRFDSPEALVSYLIAVARNKVNEVYRQRFATAKYDINRERSLDAENEVSQEQLAARQPTPSQVAVAREEWDRMLEKLPPRQREILTMLRHGETHRAIARKLGLHEKTIRRLLQRVAPEFLADDVAERSGSFEPDGLDAAS